MVDIKKGKTDSQASSDSLIQFFKTNASFEGKLYIGYPILYSGGESIIIDALWISEKWGVVIFDLIEGTTLRDRTVERDNIYSKIHALLSQYPELNYKRALMVPIEVFTFAPACNSIDFELSATSTSELLNLIKSLSTWTSPDYYTKALSVLQSVIQLKSKTDRNYIKKENSKGSIIKKLEETIANLDNQQEEAIIEYHEGLQRIRGLAGSGKTIVIALKAAYLHALHPEWNIAVTFNTRSLKNQFFELIELFCIQKIGRKPDEDKIKIVQAWGGGSSAGIYYQYCIENGVEFLDVRDAKQFARSTGQRGKNTFDLVCLKALEETKNKYVKPLYDVILVDETQDLSESFLNICFKLLSPKKRLIYAYDELQKLNEGYALRNPRNIFGLDASEIILKKCYRNSRPVLVTAHALGFGVYRKGGLAQFFDHPQLWRDVGYNVKSGNMAAGEKVDLYRADEATHKFLERYQDINDLVRFELCVNKEDQAARLTKEIKKNLEEDELLHKDIIVINPIGLTTKEEVSIARVLLAENKIRSHIAGDSNPDIFFEKDSITFTGINRAKGNEVPMVYIINADECYSHPDFHDRDLTRRRNILFTAITRSKAWVRVYGIGRNMQKLIDEFNEVKKNDFHLIFQYPSNKDIEKMNLISRDISKEEEVQYKEDLEDLFGIQKIVERIKKNEALIEDYPINFQPILKALIEKEKEGNNEE